MHRPGCPRFQDRQVVDDGTAGSTHHQGNLTKRIGAAIDGVEHAQIASKTAVSVSRVGAGAAAVSVLRPILRSAHRRGRW
jgi:hypothetical protein